MSSRRSGVKSRAVIVARSQPEPLTHMVGDGSAGVVGGGPLADVLPPPKFATARSEPSRCEA